MNYIIIEFKPFYNEPCEYAEVKKRVESLDDVYNEIDEYNGIYCLTYKLDEGEALCANMTGWMNEICY